MKHLKLFNETASYDTYKNSEDYVLPNVSYVEETKGVKYERKKAYTLRATYNATPDNLVAFTGASNIKSLNVNGTPIEIEPIKNEISTFDVLGENISINLETGEATFPESYLIKSPVSSWSFKAKDPNYTINENTYVCGLMMMDGMTMAQPLPPEEMSYAFTTNDGVTIEAIDTFLDEMNMQITMGMQISFTLMDVDMDNQTFTFIDTEHQTNVTTGGMSTYSFDSEGLYDVKIELDDSDVKDIKFAGTTLTSIEISNDITSIGSYTFYNCSSLTSITVPDSITSIVNDAFDGCYALKDVNVNITNLAEYCKSNVIYYISRGNKHLYINNKEITELVIPNSVTSIGYGAFSGFKSLTNVTIPNSVTTIGNQAFYNCSSLTSVTIGSGVTSIGSNAFYGCSGLTSITCYAQTAPIIDNYTFKSIGKFGTLYYPDGSDYSSWLSILRSYIWNMMITAYYNVTSSDNYLALYNTSEISHLYVNGTEVTNFGSSYSFKARGSYTIGIILKDNAVDIQNMFKNVKSLNSVIIDNSVTSIGEYAFYGCSSLTSVTIPDSVTEIGREAFYGCSSLTSVTIPDSVTTIGYEAFRSCTGLTSIVVSSGNTKYDSRENCNCLIETATNTIITGCNNSVIPNSVTTIGSDAFRGCTGLTSVTIGNSVTTIGNYAFCECSSLTSVTIPDSVTTIGYGAFNSCTSLTSVTIPDSVTEIGREAFYGCSSLTSVTIPDSVMKIGNYAFRSCTGLTSIVVSSGNTKYDSRENCNCLIETATNTIITGCNNSVIPNSVTTIGSDAFRGCTGLTSVTIPDSVTTIGYEAFYNCSSLTSVTIGDSVTTIGNSAFWGCSSLTSITIPNSVTSIETYAFKGCSNLTSITIGDSVTTIGNYAFYNCSSLTSVTIPDSVTTIGDCAFFGCNGLTSVTIPDSVTSIGERAFYGCNSLTSITIPDSVTTIGDYAFYNCSSLASITCYAPTAPSIKSNTFDNVPTGGTLYVPTGSDYSSWMSTDYLGKYNWTIQYI